MENNMHIRRRAVSVHFGRPTCLAFTQDDVGSKTTPLFPSQAVRDIASMCQVQARFQTDDAACTNSQRSDGRHLVDASESGQRATRNAQASLRGLCAAPAAEDRIVSLRRWVQILQYISRPLSAGTQSQEFPASHRTHASGIPFTVTFKE
jgi:hypothetical protein